MSEIIAISSMALLGIFCIYQTVVHIKHTKELNNMTQSLLRSYKERKKLKRRIDRFNDVDYLNRQYLRLRYRKLKIKIRKINNQYYIEPQTRGGRDISTCKPYDKYYQAHRDAVLMFGDRYMIKKVD